MKYAAFDVGNVLVNVDFPSFINKLSKTLNITVEEATYFMNRSQKLHDLGLTVMRDELIDHLKIKSSVLRDELIQDWNYCITPADWMLEKLDELATTNNIQIALLSNVGLEHAARMKEILNHNGLFDKSIKHFSCEVGARKPTYLYYQSFLQLHPEFQGAPYFDDLQENLDAGTKFGFKPFRLSLEEISGKNYNEDVFKAKMNDFEAFLLQDV
jgi:FMN phosphatase YigB (HAD superfamily)